MKDETAEFLALQLPDIDRILASLQVNVRQRPLRAASMIVDHCIVRIEGDTKDNYFKKPWFSVIYRETKRWYKERYGQALSDSQSDVVYGFVLIFDTPFELAIPLGVREEDEPGETFWLCLPTSVMPGERVLDWIITPPNLERLVPSEHEALVRNIVRVAEHLRAIRVNLMTADYPNRPSRKLSEGIIPHLERGAKDIVRNPRERTSLAIWEFHLAAERAMKVYLWQRGIEPPNTHDLDQLNRLSGSGGDTVVPTNLVSKLPSGTTAIRHRYGEADPPDLESTIDIYTAAMQLIGNYARGLTRRFTFDNARFLLKVPPWAKREA